MQTINESYQNSNYCTNTKRIKLNQSKSTSRIYKNYLSQIIKKNEQYQRLITLKFFNIFLAERKKISIEKFLINKDRLEQRQSINENLVSIKKQTVVISQTKIQDIQNKIDNLQIEIKKVQKKRKRISLFFDYSFFMYENKKIDSDTFSSLRDKKYEKRKILSRVHDLLINEQSRLIIKNSLLVV